MISTTNSIYCYETLPYLERDAIGYSFIQIEVPVPDIVKVIFRDPYTIVKFSDGEKVVVEASGEKFDKEKGLAMAIVRKFYPNRNFFKKLISTADVQTPEK